MSYIQVKTSATRSAAEKLLHVKNSLNQNIGKLYIECDNHTCSSGYSKDIYKSLKTAITYISNDRDGLESLGLVLENISCRYITDETEVSELFGSKQSFDWDFSERIWDERKKVLEELQSLLDLIPGDCIYVSWINYFLDSLIIIISNFQETGYEVTGRFVSESILEMEITIAEKKLIDRMIPGNIPAEGYNLRSDLIFRLLRRGGYGLRLGKLIHGAGKGPE